MNESQLTAAILRTHGWNAWASEAHGIRWASVEQDADYDPMYAVDRLKAITGVCWKNMGISVTSGKRVYRTSLENEHEEPKEFDQAA